jgi:hypothetical protein
LNNLHSRSLLPAICAAALAALPAAQAQDAAAKPRIERLAGVWIEGPGFDITYGKDYDACAGRCLANERCVMIEYYRPERKCNLYDTVKPRKPGGSSIVGLKR